MRITGWNRLYIVLVMIWGVIIAVEAILASPVRSATKSGLQAKLLTAEENYSNADSGYRLAHEKLKTVTTSVNEEISQYNKDEHVIALNKSLNEAKKQYQNHLLTHKNATAFDDVPSRLKHRIDAFEKELSEYQGKISELEYVKNAAKSDLSSAELDLSLAKLKLDLQKIESDKSNSSLSRIIGFSVTLWSISSILVYGAIFIMLRLASWVSQGFRKNKQSS